MIGRLRVLLQGVANLAAQAQKRARLRCTPCSVMRTLIMDEVTLPSSSVMGRLTANVRVSCTGMPMSVLSNSSGSMPEPTW